MKAIGRICLLGAVSLGALGAIGCGGPSYGVKVDIADPVSGPLVLSVPKGQGGPYKAVLQRGTVMFREKALGANTVRGQEMDTEIKRLRQMLMASGLVREVVMVEPGQVADPGPEEIALVLSCNEDGDDNRGGNAASGFASGLLTLGLAPPRLQYGYESAMKIEALCYGGEKRTYRADTKAIIYLTTYVRRPDFQKDVNSAFAQGRHAVDVENFRRLLHKMVADRQYFAVATQHAPKPKETPHAQK